MIKKLLITICLLIGVQAFAGELENALTQNKNVFLYLYTPECGYCQMFAPRYDKLSKKYDKNYKFIKLNASTAYGWKVFRHYKGHYFPDIVLINSKNKTAHINPDCLMNDICTERVLTTYIK